ncbi:MAG TPA: AAA family ATPase [Candidatus Saccharimonadales bacterium]|nr:AAA family ATPase [Candidatus Saccharimonadales bacterium]
MPITRSQLPTGQIVEDRSNGNGYRAFMPDNPEVFNTENAIKALDDRFLEGHAIIEAIGQHESVVLAGAPGSGKSNFIQDVESACEKLSVPTLRIAIHQAVGKLVYLDNTIERIEKFASESTGGLFIIDNVDYFAYKGKSRTRTNAMRAAEQLVPALVEVIEGRSTYVLGTGHTRQWQQNHWMWNEETIDNAQEALWQAFDVSLPFEGILSVQGLSSVLTERHPEVPKSRINAAVRVLCALKAPSFHMAYHIDMGLLFSQPRAAQAAVEQGRAQRMRLPQSD